MSISHQKHPMFNIGQFSSTNGTWLMQSILQLILEIHMWSTLWSLWLMREERKKKKKNSTTHPERLSTLSEAPDRSVVHLPNQQTNTVLTVAWWSRTACFCSRLELKHQASNFFLDAHARSLKRCYMRKSGKLFPELQRYGTNRDS